MCRTACVGPQVTQVPRLEDNVVVWTEGDPEYSTVQLTYGECVDTGHGVWCTQRCMSTRHRLALAQSRDEGRHARRVRVRERRRRQPAAGL